MTRYLILSGCITILALVVAYVLGGKRTFRDKKTYVTLSILLLLTAVFDSLIIIAGIVAYNTDYITGFYIGKAPIEDFFYTLASVPLSIALWRFYDPKK